MEQMRKRIKILGAVMLTLIVFSGAAAMYTVENAPITQASANEGTSEETGSVTEWPAAPTPTPVILIEAGYKETRESEYYWEGNDPDFEGYPEPPYTDQEIEMLAKTVWGEARGCSAEEQSLVIWTVFQRVDAGGEFRNYNTIEAVITKKNAFIGYYESNPVIPEIYELCAAQAAEWAHGAEPPLLEPYALAVPYLFFEGDGKHNWFRAEW